MESIVDNNRKLMTIWLTRCEGADAEMAVKLRSLYQELAKKKYTVAVFISGNEDLWDNTSALLIHNRNKAAELDAKQETELV